MRVFQKREMIEKLESFCEGTALAAAAAAATATITAATASARKPTVGYAVLAAAWISRWEVLSLDHACTQNCSSSGAVLLTANYSQQAAWGQGCRQWGAEHS